MESPLDPYCWGFREKGLLGIRNLDLKMNIFVRLKTEFYK